MFSIFPIIAGTVAATYILLLTLLRLTQDAAEPPSVNDTFPFITTVLSTLSKGTRLHRLMRDQYNLPIHTLRLPGSRLYVINSPALITSAQSQIQTLSFTAIQSGIVTNILGVNKATNEIIGRDVTSHGNYLTSFPKYIHPTLIPGPGLDDMNKRSIQAMAKSLDALVGKGITTVKLFQWVRHELLLAFTEGVYGPRNPFRNAEMEQAWYTFEPGFMMFALNLFPRLFARKSYQAREYMVKIWEGYFETGSHHQGSEMIKARVKINEDFQISLKDTARLEVGGTHGLLSNTLPGTFWTVYHIFSDPVVLEDIRNELSRGVQSEADGSCTIDLTYIKSSCPILLSTFKETMRIHSTGTSTRKVLQDHRLDNKYLLKKGSTVMMPSAVQHTNRHVWGDTVDEFDHKRFVPGAKRVNPVAFRGFGGGSTLCPGRQFASTEILMFSALLVLRFDLRPVSGRWTAPSTANSSMANSLPVPDWDFDVELRPRDDKDWKISFSGSHMEMEIAAEDIEGAISELSH
ncbi:cytochrome P450 [Annulohypoxylon truncatum]|uniref:cytochrome P450 n=1 Tax=Annulohypoxylon truncatum TaxID=327061 RepID=UPI002007A9CE|nr:cytochrome P450 [Annulohypoxylon truncatum]KAI1207081.1 cytochrome P450 [Annulohypoxylon truncatum]